MVTQEPQIFAQHPLDWRVSKSAALLLPPLHTFSCCAYWEFVTRYILKSRTWTLWKLLFILSIAIGPCAEMPLHRDKLTQILEMKCS